jgi:hypothetical protein
MKGLLQLLLVLILSVRLNAQANSFYANGYLQIKSDTVWCKILFNPDIPAFKATISTLLHDKEVEIALNKNDSLIAFGIVDGEYNHHFGRVKIPGAYGLTIAFNPKIVWGTLELITYNYAIYSGGFGKTAAENKQLFTEYFIGEANNNSIEFPKKLPTLTIKKISEYLSGFTIPAALNKKKLSEPEAVSLLKMYNEWAINRK